MPTIKEEYNKQRLQEQGIHPSLEKLIYLTEEEFKFFKALREGFLRKAGKFFKAVKAPRKRSPERLVERRSLTIEKDVKSTKGFIYQKEAMYWRWQRVKEYYQELTMAERYEQLAKEIKT